MNDMVKYALELSFSLNGKIRFLFQVIACSKILNNLQQNASLGKNQRNHVPFEPCPFLAATIKSFITYHKHYFESVAIVNFNAIGFRL